MLALLVNGRSTPQYRRVAVRLNDREKALVRIYINYMKRIDIESAEYQEDMNRELSILLGETEMTYEDYCYFEIGMEWVESTEFSLGEEMNTMLVNLYRAIEFQFYDRNAVRVDLEQCLWQPSEEEIDAIFGGKEARTNWYAECERRDEMNLAMALKELEELK